MAGPLRRLLVRSGALAGLGLSAPLVLSTRCSFAYGLYFEKVVGLGNPVKAGYGRNRHNAGALVCDGLGWFL
jgi:hypothetical protein